MQSPVYALLHHLAAIRLCQQLRRMCVLHDVAFLDLAARWAFQSKLWKLKMTMQAQFALVSAYATKYKAVDVAGVEGAVGGSLPSGTARHEPMGESESLVALSPISDERMHSRTNHKKPKMPPKKSLREQLREQMEASEAKGQMRTVPKVKDKDMKYAVQLMLLEVMTLKEQMARLESANPSVSVPSTT
eukprot:m.327964 g.327964  ORF g.327964 m.327964 type:complete len:189 (+) comp16028_c3_seq4:1097-1663(+)